MEKLKSKFRICVAGSAEAGFCGIDAYEVAKDLGREIVKQGNILITGASHGFSFWTTIGAQEEGGMSIGISPASSKREHLNVYRLPLEYMDLVIYSGFGPSGRNILLTRSSDALIVGCGRLEAISEFNEAFKEGKPIGVLEGVWPTDETINSLIVNSGRGNEKIVFDTDPKRLVEKLQQLILIDERQGELAKESL